MTDETGRMNGMTPTELAEAERDRKRARVFFWAWLALATMLTLTGNAADAALDQLDPLAVRLAVRLIPPAVGALGIASWMVLSRAGVVHRARHGGWAAIRASGPVYMTSVVLVALTILAALVLSYSGLAEVAQAGGVVQPLCFIWPLTIDAGVVVSTIALAALRPASAADLRAAREASRAASPAASAAASPMQHASPQVNAVQHAAAQHPTQHDVSRGTRLMPQPVPQDAPPPGPDAALPAAAPAAAMQHVEPSAAHHAAAQRVVAAGEAAGHPVSRIATVLALRAAGLSARKISEQTGVDARRVGAWVRVAQQQQQSEELAAHPTDEQTGSPDRERVLERVG